MEPEILNHTRNPADSGLGIKVLVEGIAPTIDIVAIHGLDGHREGSWTAENGILWLKDLLPQQLPNVRIVTYGYDASTGSQSYKIDETLYGHGENFISRLALLRESTTTATRPIIFIAHSLGGIILKFALIHANQCNESHLPHHKRIMLSTIGILFFGTPHQGAALALSASQMLLVRLPVDENTSHTLLRNLAINSEMLEIQLALYNGISACFNTKFLYEIYQTVLDDGTSGFIVPRSSAIVPGARNAEPIGLNKNHTDMTKYCSAKDDDFIVVVSLLQGIKSDLPTLEPVCGKDVTQSDDILNKGPSYRPKLLSSPRFTGQDIYLEKLRTFFVNENITLCRKHLLLYGMGGIGKTQISLKFAEECADLKLYWRILWLDATTAETLETSFAEISKLDPVMKSLEIEESGKYITGWLAGLERKCLLIFDNADGMTTLVSKYIPLAHSLDVLITSRNSDLQQSVSNTLNLEVMSKEDALSLLMKSSMRESKTELLKDGPLQMIAETLGLLPLALDIAGAAIYMGLCTVEEYTSRYLENHEILLCGNHPLYKGASLYNQTIYDTLNISYELIEKKNPQGDIAKDALFLLKMLGFFHHQNIMEIIFKKAAEAPEWYIKDSQLRTTWLDLPSQFLKCDEHNQWIHTKFRTIMQLLCDYSLISKVPSITGLSWTIHPIVQIWVRDKVVMEKQVIYLAAARALIVNSINGNEDLVEHSYHFHRMILPHMITYYQYNADFGLSYCDDEHSAQIEEFVKNGYWNHASRFCQQVLDLRKLILGSEHYHSRAMILKLAYIWKRQGKYGKAQELEVQVLETHKQLLGLEHPDTLRSMGNLASSLKNLGKYTEAQELEVQVLEAHQQLLGPEHPSTLTSMGNLAYTLSDLGKYTEAQELEVQVLEAYKQLLGPNHPSTLTSMRNLASTLKNLGKYTEAQELEVQVLEAHRQLLGPKHPSTLTSMGKLACTLSDLGKYTEAQELEVQVLEACKTLLGPDHPSTLTCMANLASTLKNLRKYTEAQELEVQVLEARKQLLGPEHPDTLTSMGNLAYTLSDLGRYTEAQELEVQVLEARKQLLGPEHPSTLTSMGNLAYTLSDMGKYTEAQELEVQVLEAYKQLLGPNHPSTLTSMRNLASTLKNLGKYTEAQELEVQVLEAHRQLLGQKHPSTLTSMGKLACTLSDLGKYTEAQELEVQVLEACKTLLGPDHPSTLTCMANLASTLKNLREYTEAQELEVQVLEARKQLLGPEHPDTLTSMGNLAYTLSDLGKYTEAQELEVQVLEARKQLLGPEHPSTLTSMGNLAYTLSDLGKYTEAQELEVQVLEAHKQLVGPDHPSTLISMRNLASTLKNLGKYTEAQELEVQVLDAYKQLFGPDHPDTLTSMGKLASTLKTLGMCAEAQELEVQVLEAHKQLLGPGHPSTLASMANLASTMKNLGKYTEAQKLEVQVLEVCKQLLGPRASRYINIHGKLASTFNNL
ncbi:hypothetical protein BU17DRAFT_78714 [Hysterangium stoloniferum]|nr:hypothetical protein BU17DRAFT_78714 [Hysterangium stoloniferum]